MLRSPQKVLLIGVVPRSLVNFRGPLLKELLHEGHSVFAAANGRDPDTETKLREMGVEYCPIRLARTGLNPLADMATVWDLVRLMRRTKPQVVLSYTIKPIIYGGLAANLCGVQRVFSMVEGLGSVFMSAESPAHFISSLFAKVLYRIGLSGSDRVFFLNPDDRTEFIGKRYVPREKAVLLDGIGIDLAHFTEDDLPRRPGLRFLMVARLLRDKGVSEYLNAAKILRQRQLPAEFILAGDLDENPNSISRDELDRWQREGLVQYTGFIEDIRPLFRRCDVFVLPSFYREGTPRTSLEAMATGRAVITTDVPGCRETVRPAGGASSGNGLKIGRNGILVPAKDPKALAEAMEFFIKNPDQIAVMGRESRAYAEQRYDVRKVNEMVLREMGLRDR